jgi:hypothetical protein
MKFERVIFVASIGLCSAVIYVVHYQQTAERTRMRAGVYRDIAKLEAQKKES